MNVVVKLFASLRINNEKEYILDVAEGSTPIDIIHQLNISEEDAAIVMINGRRKELDTVLFEDDIISIFPLVGGG